MMHQISEKEREELLKEMPLLVEDSLFYCYKCGRRLPSQKMIRVYEDHGISFFICPEHLER